MYRAHVSVGLSLPMCPVDASIVHVHLGYSLYIGLSYCFVLCHKTFYLIRFGNRLIVKNYAALIEMLHNLDPAPIRNRSSMQSTKNHTFPQELVARHRHGWLDC